MLNGASAATVYYSADFTRSIPEDMTLTDGDGTAIVSDDYKNGYTDLPWASTMVGTYGYAAVSLSHTDTDEPQDNWMVTPYFNVKSPEAFVRWDARSVLPSFPESYKVMVKVEGEDDFRLLYSNDAEDERWVKRVASLRDYEGKNVCVAFVCNSVNRYMLAIGRLEVGEFDDDGFVVVNRTPRYCGDTDLAPVSLTITNVGGSATLKAFVAVVDDEIVSRQLLDGPFAMSQSVDVSLEIPVSLNEKTAYAVKGEREDGSTVDIISGDVFCSHFARRLFLDKGSGMWCNNCPNGNLIVDKLRREYPGQLIVAESHASPDILAVPDYWSGLEFYAVPYFMLNRDQYAKGEKESSLKSQLEVPTIVGFDITGCSLSDDGRQAVVSAKVAFAEDIDNSDDRYRIGYTVIRDYQDPDDDMLYQKNSLSGTTYEQYHFLPSRIPKELAVFHDVVRDGAAAHQGLEGSLPAEIKAGEVNGCDFTVLVPAECPAELSRIAAYVLDTTTGIIQNADVVSLDGLGGVLPVVAGNQARDAVIDVSRDGDCFLSFGNPGGRFVLDVVGADGRVLKSVSGIASAEAVPVSLSGICGFVIIRVTHNGCVTVTKQSL